ncbi:NAD(P)-dependent oxidoreductase [Halarchaeum acidiphilum]|uniref:NAD(P)-dependent oxidoreductase n=1 Tax=Halarchaeum acidiphilum TaxID=489138 RepID=UPI00373FDE9F
MTADLLDAASSLSVVAKHGAGVDNIDIPAATRNGVLVANTPGANARSVAEHAVALLLAVKRRVPQAHDATRAGEWRRHDFRGHEQSGRTLGLLGAGNAGRDVARLLSGFDVSVCALDPYVDPAALPENVSLVDTVDALFEAADDVSVHAPLTDETRHAVGRDQLAALPGDGVVVNTARGGIVDEAALRAALDAGDLLGAGIDVYESEPPAADDPLLARDDVVLTQHNAGVTAEALRAMSREAAAVVRTVYEGGVPETALNADALGR